MNEIMTLGDIDAFKLVTGYGNYSSEVRDDLIKFALLQIGNIHTDLGKTKGYHNS